MYCLRIGGTSEFVSKIDPNDARCIPPGSITTVEGWNDPNILFFDTPDEASAAADMVEYIEGCAISIEHLN